MFQLKFRHVHLPGDDTNSLCSFHPSCLAVTPGPPPSPAQITLIFQFIWVVSVIYYLRKLKARKAQ